MSTGQDRYDKRSERLETSARGKYISGFHRHEYGQDRHDKRSERLETSASEKNLTGFYGHEYGLNIYGKRSERLGTSAYEKDITRDDSYEYGQNRYDKIPEKSASGKDITGDSRQEYGLNIYGKRRERLGTSAYEKDITRDDRYEYGQNRYDTRREKSASGKDITGDSRQEYGQDRYDKRSERLETSARGKDTGNSRHEYGQNRYDTRSEKLETPACGKDITGDDCHEYELKNKGRTSRYRRKKKKKNVTTITQSQEKMNSPQQQQDEIASDVKTLVCSQILSDKKCEETTRSISSLHEEHSMIWNAVEDIREVLTQKLLQKDVQADQHIQPNAAENQKGAESNVKEWHGARPKLPRGRTSTENEDLEQEKIVPNRGRNMPRSKTLFKDDNYEKDTNQSEDEEKSQSQYDTKRISPWKIDQEAWRHCTESKTQVEFTEEGKRLLTESKIPNDNLLGIIFDRFRGKEIVKEICDAVCEYIKQTNENIIEVWAGYEYKNNTTIGYKVIFVIITKCSQDITNDDFTVICRGFYEISCKDENLELLRREREDPPKYEDLRLAKQALRKYAPALIENHKKLTRATISWMKATIGKPLKSGIRKCMCIALYIQVRGVVPINEEPFPNILEGLPVDVREGIIKPCKGPTEHHKHLKIGCAIRGQEYVGTLGPFVKFQNRENEQYVLTCAHVLFQGELLRNILRGDINSGIGQKVYQPGTTGPNENPFGEVVLTKHKKGRNGLAGMEIALIQVHERNPTSGKFPDAPNYADAGFGPEKPFTFTSGEVLPVSVLRTHRVVWKYGSESQLTKGEIRITESSIRTRSITSRNTSVELTLNGQIEVVSSDNVCFARAGDSGALVLTFSELTGQLAAVGMLEGETVDGTCFLVTPLVHILNELATLAGSDCYLNKYPQCQTLNYTEVEDPMMDTAENESEVSTSTVQELDHKFDLLNQRFENHKEEIKQELSDHKKVFVSQQAALRKELKQQQETQNKQYSNITQMLEKLLKPGNNPNFNAQN